MQAFISIFNELNIDVYEPFEQSNNILKARVIGLPFSKKKLCGNKSDCIFAIVNGNPPDEVMIELGIALALKKKIFLFRDDFRNCSDCEQYPLNLMLFLGLPEDNWQKYYLESLEDITSIEKNFLGWVQDKNK